VPAPGCRTFLFLFLFLFLYSASLCVSLLPCSKLAQLIAADPPQ